jgi:hypothetical protein
MSDYQYYEFAAIDRPLIQSEMAKLRAISTRAVITPGGFTNHYEWGDLKADPAEWMRHYFDAFVYSANWCSCHLSLRLPKAAFGKAELRPFITQTTLLAESSDTHWILGWTLDESEDYDRFAEDDGSGWMRRLIPLRDELLRGDLRPLYLGWLAAGDALDDDTQEPDVPPGLAELSPAQQALVEFLEIDPDLLEAASTGSAASMPAGDDETTRMTPWLDTWQVSDMKDMLTKLALGHGQEAERQVKSRYAAWLKAQRPVAPDSPRRRVAELRGLAQSVAAIRRVREAKAHAKREAERRRQHEAKLRQLMAAPDESWKAANAHAARGGASGYDQAMRILAELAESYALVSSREAFDRELRRFLIPHARRAALLRRLADAGLWSG